MWLCYDACLYGVAMLPELHLFVVATTAAIIAEHVYEQFSAAFLRVGVHRAHDLLGRSAFAVAQHKVERIFLCAANEVKMVGHDDIGL